MTIATKHKSVINLVAVGVYDASASDYLDSEVQQSFRSNIGNDLDTDLAVAFQNTENRNFASGSSSSFAFATAAEIGFVYLNLSTKKDTSIFGVGENGHPYGIHSLIDGVVAHGKLFGYLSGGEFQFKELYDSEPLTVGKISVVYPSSASVVKSVITARTTIPLVNQFIQFSSSATRAKSLLVFEAKSQHVFS